MIPNGCGYLSGLASLLDAGAGMLRFWKEDAEMPADEMFGNLHSFIQVRHSKAGRQGLVSTVLRCWQ